MITLTTVVQFNNSFIVTFGDELQSAEEDEVNTATLPFSLLPHYRAKFEYSTVQLFIHINENHLHTVRR